MARQRVVDESGTTLIEILFAVLLLGICGTALIGAVGTATASSGKHEALANVGTILTGFAETAQYDIEMEPNIWVECATSPSSYNKAISYTLPSKLSSGYSVTITGVTPFDPLNVAFDDANCASLGDGGLQQLTLTATGPFGVLETMNEVIRDPSYQSSNAGLF